jgi:pyrroloquinoline quinone biosynthesis protein B
MKIRVLGSSAGGGLPQWNCGCNNCVRARAGDPAVPPRSQPSIAVSADGERWSVLNASPDIREQFAGFPGLHPRPGTRDVPLDTILISNADIDHVLGLLVLRESLPYRIVSTDWIRAALLDHNLTWRVLESAWGCAKLDEPIRLDRDGKLEASFFPVPGKVPYWLGERVTNAPEATVGVRITDTRSGRRLVYAPGSKSLDSAMLAELEASDCAFVDGTFFTSDELQVSRPDAVDAYTMGHVPITGDPGSLDTLAKLGTRCLYIHLNNTNPVLDSDSEACARVAAAGVEIALDGMEFEL